MNYQYMEDDLMFSDNYHQISEDEYYKNLRRIQAEHLNRVREQREQKRRFQPCLHDGCPECHGTGVKLNGSACIHMISCPCPKCTPYFL